MFKKDALEIDLIMRLCEHWWYLKPISLSSRKQKHVSDIIVDQATVMFNNE